MEHEIKIFFNDRVVVLTDKDINNSENDNDCIHVFENRKALSQRLKRFEKSNDERLCIVHHNLNVLFKHVAGCFKFIEAAGGLVTLPDGRILMIKRLGKWDLPKGKSEKGESLQETAVREVVEECGLASLPIITGELLHTFHTYYRNKKHILKHTAWYTMQYDGDETLYPQLNEDITEAVWLPKNRLDTVLQNTYKSIKQVLKAMNNEQ